MQQKVTGKKKRRSKKLLLFLIFAIGGGAGWYLKDENRRQEAIKASEDIPGLIDKASKNLPVLLDQGKEVVMNFDYASVTSMFANAPLTFFRLYDAYTPLGVRNILSEGMPDFFAYPYICRLSRIFTPGKGEERQGTTIRAIVGGEELQWGKGFPVYPGAKLSSDGNLAFEVQCQGESIAVGTNSTVQFLRGSNVDKFFRVDGVITMRTGGARVVGFSFPWGEVSMAVNGGGSMQFESQANPPALNIYEGDVSMVWQVTSTKVGAKAGDYTNLKVVAGSDAKLRITRRYGPDKEERRVAPRKEVYFLASGQFSDSKGVRPKQAAQPKPKAEPRGRVSSTELIKIEKALLAAKTPWFTLGNTVDLTINWQLSPVNRLVPCTVELSVDPTMGSLLATYQSARMSLFLKGVQPATYYWRARCEVDGNKVASPVAKIQVVDGKKNPPVPELTSPDEGQKTSSPVQFRWNKIKGAKGYVLQFSQFRDFRDAKLYNAKNPGLNMNLKKKGTYYWRVVGVSDVKELKTGASLARSFKF